jgi:hypothetical protein
MNKIILTILILTATCFGSGNFEISDGDVKILSPDGTSTIFLFGNSGLGQFNNIVDASLTGVNVYADGDGLLISTIPPTGTLGFWTRSETPDVLTPSNIGDDLDLTGDLDLNDGFVRNVGYILFDTDFANGTEVGRLQWNSDVGTLEFGLPGGTVNLQIGQEFVKPVLNNSGSTIGNGTPVYISGSFNDVLTIAPADADFGLGIGFRTYGVATEDILNGEIGYVTKDGVVRDIDFSLLAAGMPQYLAVGGGYSVTPPAAPHIVVLVGIIEKATVDGELDVNIVSLPNLNNLSDVTHENAKDGDILTWDNSTKVWLNDYPTIKVPMVLTSYDAKPVRLSESNIHGGLLALAVGDPLETGTDIDVVKGIGKILIVIHETGGDDYVGDIIVTVVQIQ